MTIYRREKEKHKRRNYIIKNLERRDASMLFNGFGGCGNMPKDCGCDNNCMWIILLLLIGNCGGGINGCVDICSLIFLLLLLSICDNNNCK